MLPSTFTAILRGFSNATFNRSIGSSGSTCLMKERQCFHRRVRNILAHLSAKYAIMVESIPPLKKTATRAEPGALLCSIWSVLI